MLAIAVPLLAVVVSAGCLVQISRIGDSGAKAVWQNNFSHSVRSPGAGPGDNG